MLERWNGLMSDRATIIVRLLHGSCNGCEAARALYDFASQSSDEVCISRLVRDASFVSQRQSIFGSRDISCFVRRESLEKLSLKTSKGNTLQRLQAGAVYHGA